MNKTIHTVETRSDFDAMLEVAERHSIVALDTETVGLQSAFLFAASRLVGYGVAEQKYERINGIYKRCYSGKRFNMPNKLQWRSPKSKSFSVAVREEVERSFNKLEHAKRLYESFNKSALESRSGLNFWENVLGMVQLGLRTGNHVDSYLIRPTVIDNDRFGEFLNTRSTILLHNAQFDWKQFKQHLGIELHCYNLFDTQIAEYVLLNGKSRVEINGQEFSVVRKVGDKWVLRTSMKDVAERRLGLTMDKDLATRLTDWTTAWDDNKKEYAALDVVIPFFLFDQQSEELEASAGLKTTFRRECELVPCTAMMEMEGLGLDVDALNKLKDQKVQEREAAIDACVEAFNIPPYLPQHAITKQLNAPAKVKALLLDAGVEVEKTDKKSLAELEDVPQVQALLTYRKTNKIITTYVDPFYRMLVGTKDGARLYGEFKQCFTETGRYSSENPNFQNFPSLYEFRKIFVPKKSTSVFIDGDLASIEPRILAHVTKDPVLLRAFKEGRDPYKNTAALFLGIPFDEVDGDTRKKFKAVKLGVAYGKTEYGLAKDLNISLEEARSLLIEYFKIHYGVKVWRDSSIALAHARGYVETITGRVRHLPGLYSKEFKIRNNAENAVLNTQIQSPAADFMKESIRMYIGLIKKSGLVKDYPLVLTLHDELLAEAPDTVEGHRLGKSMIKWALVEGTKKYVDSVPILVGEEPTYEPRVIRNWGEAKLSEEELEEIVA